MDAENIMRLIILIIVLVVASVLSWQIGKIDGKTVECNRSNCTYHENNLCRCKYLKLKHLTAKDMVCNSYIYRQSEGTISFNRNNKRGIES